MTRLFDKIYHPCRWNGIVLLTLFFLMVPGHRISRAGTVAADRPVYALVIQESDYVAGWPNLSYQEPSVNAVVRLFREMGVDVQRYINCTHLDLDKIIKEFFRNRRNAHPLLLIAYFGHTYSDREGRSCLIPTDVPLPKTWQGRTPIGIIPLDDLVNQALQSQTDSVIFINSSVSLRSDPKQNISDTVHSSTSASLVMAAGQQGEAIPTQSHFLDLLIKELKKKLKRLHSHPKYIDIYSLCQMLIYEGIHNSWRMPWYKILGANKVATDRKWLLNIHRTPKSKKSFLTVLTDTDDAVVRILNIKPKYTPGMELSPGRYQVEITAEGKTQTKWIRLMKGEHAFLSIPHKPSQNFYGTLQPDDIPEKNDDRPPADEVQYPHRTFLENYGFSLIKVEHGGFIMGGDRFNEGPKHPVLIKQNFFIMDREVPVELYERFLKDTGKILKDNHGAGPRYPAVNVSWSDANNFAEWLSKITGRNFRLPTEEEWEYVARRPTDLTDSEVTKKLVPVDEAVANQLGVRGMLGNVWEWCADCWHQRYAPGNSLDDNAAVCNNRVIRGGSWRNNIRLITPTSRNGISYKTRATNIGFRLIVEEEDGD